LLPVPHPPALNVCAATARRIEEIVSRNRIRQEAGLPLLCILKELRRMKTTDDLAEFERFATRHREAVWDEVLAPVREAKGQSNEWDVPGCYSLIVNNLGTVNHPEPWYDSLCAPPQK